MNKICQFCENRKYIPLTNVYECNKKDIWDSSGYWYRTPNCIHDDTLKDLFTPIKDITEETNKMIERVKKAEIETMTYRDKLNSLIRKITDDQDNNKEKQQ